MPSPSKDPSHQQTLSKPNIKSTSKLLHHLTTSPPRPSYLAQKAHIFAASPPRYAPLIAYHRSSKCPQLEKALQGLAGRFEHSKLSTGVYSQPRCLRAH